MNDKIITQQDAKAQGLKRYFTGKPCKHGHIAERLVSDSKCLKCAQEKLARWKENNKEKARRHSRLWKAKNSKARAQYQRNWCAKNPGAKRASELRQKNRVPAWADLDAINEIYIQARAMSDATGVLHHVDHIIPINGESVSGLHVANNLQILTASENLKKGNNREPQVRAR